MIKQVAVGLNSRSEANPFNEDGFLPLITAPMYSVVDENNYQVFLDNKVQVCMPRNTKVEDIGDFDRVFFALSLEEFIINYIEASGHSFFNIDNEPNKVCIDTANGNIPALHDAIRKAKEIHGDKLIIMAGNVASVEAFEELAKTGVDYIRVGIGGGGGCNTTSNIGIGQEDLGELIEKCYHRKTLEEKCVKQAHQEGIDQYYQRNGVHKDYRQEIYTNQINISKVKIVADGISSYIKLCQEKYGFNDNGYAAINELLFAGADLVMIGKLFAQCVESAGEKNLAWHPIGGVTEEDFNKYRNTKNPIMVKYAGMSTHEEQKKYRPTKQLHEKVPEVYGIDFKPSEGSVKWIPVRWTIKEWLEGNASQDEYPYLMGWVNSIKSAMSYAGIKNLNHARKNS